MEASKLGLYFDEFVVGETVEHALSKTIFESDNNFFIIGKTKCERYKKRNAIIRV